MSVLDDFERMRLYRKRASEFEWLADTYPISSVRLRYRIISRHYTELADREEQSDKARISERLERVRLKRKEAAQRTRLSAGSDTLFFMVAAE
jgi:ABC-type uncharacterized transport system ATPase subunit